MEINVNIENKEKGICDISIKTFDYVYSSPIIQLF